MNFVKKYRVLPITVKATFWFTVCNVLLKGISFISVPLFTRFLTSDEYGKMSVFYSFEQMFMIFATFEMYNGAYQRGYLEFHEDQEDFLESILLLSFFLTTICFSVVSLKHLFFEKLTQMPYRVLTIMFAYLLVQPAYNCWLTRERFQYNYFPVVLYTLLYAGLSTSVALVTVALIKPSAETKILATYSVQIFLCIPFLVKHVHIRKIYERRKKFYKYIKYALKFQGPLVFHSLSFLILMQADRVMIGRMVNNSKAAIYSVAYSMAFSVSILQTSINQVYKPFRYKALEEGEYDEIKKSTNSLLYLLAGGIFAFILLVPDVFKLLFTETYYESIYLIPVISVSIFYMFLYSIFTDIESYYHRTNYIAYVSVLCALINVILNYVGIKIWGYVICAYTTLFCYILFSVFHYIFTKKVCKEHNLDIELLLDTKRILFIGTKIIIGMVISLCLYRTFALRYAVTVAIFCYMWLKRSCRGTK